MFLSLFGGACYVYSQGAETVPQDVWVMGDGYAAASEARSTLKPHLEGLEDRIVPALDAWIAPPSNQALSWDVGTNWSAGHSPAAGDTAAFADAQPGGSGSNTSCFIPAGDNLPTLGMLQVGSWSGTLTLNSNLPANTVSIVSKAGAGGVVINQGSNLYALQSLTWAGGSVSGGGKLEIGGGTVNCTDATNKPTLGSWMDIGTSYLGTNYSGGLTFATSSQPLVVNSNGNIYINGGSSLTFAENSGNGSDMTAISNGDTNVHSIIVNGGTLNRTNYCQLFVSTGLDVESGQVSVGNPQGQNSGFPLHFTRPNQNGSGLLVNGGTLSLQGDLTSDFYGYFGGGSTTVGNTAAGNNTTLTLGVNANSPTSQMNGGTFILLRNLVPHGGFSLYGGTFGTGGSIFAIVTLDTGNKFEMDGGELDITQGGLGSNAQAVGELIIKGDFEADSGMIVDTVDSSNNNHGYFLVTGNATLSANASFWSQDLNPNVPPGYTNTWVLMAVQGTRSGDFSYVLPPKWFVGGWIGGSLEIAEKT